MWDSAGQERFQSLGVVFIRGSNSIYLVIDLTNKSSLETLKKLIKDLEQYLPAG